MQRFKSPGSAQKFLSTPRRLQHLTWGGLRSRVKFSRSFAPPVGVGIQGLSPIAQPGRLRTRSNLICGTARGARSFSIDFTRVDGAFICTALKHGT
jgi:hypothetical protein